MYVVMFMFLFLNVFICFFYVVPAQDVCVDYLSNVHFSNDCDDVERNYFGFISWSCRGISGYLHVCFTKLSFIFPPMCGWVSLSLLYRNQNVHRKRGPPTALLCGRNKYFIETIFINKPFLANFEIMNFVWRVFLWAHYSRVPITTCVIDPPNFRLFPIFLRPGVFGFFVKKSHFGSTWTLPLCVSGGGGPCPAKCDIVL